MISTYKPFKDDYVTKNKLFAYFNSFLDKEKTIPDLSKKIEFHSVIKNLVDSNKLGPIVMATPEYGKWTKTGGLGVMTDELARGLAELGEAVYIITPWYENKNKANPGMLEKDNIKFVKNFDIFIGQEKFTVGLHYGVV